MKSIESENNDKFSSKVVILNKDVSLEMIHISGGSFMMGSPELKSRSNLKSVSDEYPQHQVTVAPFWMSKYLITQAQYQAIIGENPSCFKADNRPVERVSWYNAVEFCDRLSAHTKQSYSLPSEAQWEYACRAGTTTPFYFSEAITTDLANYNGIYSYPSGPEGTCRGETTNVGSFLPNDFGLYDMSGNVWEWCLDHWHDNYNNAPNDGSAWITGGDSRIRVVRGGSWIDSPRSCRSACRDYIHPAYRLNSYGFRVVYPA